MIFGLLHLLKFLCLIWEFSLDRILKKTLNNQISIKEYLIPTDFEKYNKYIISGKLNNAYMLCKLNLIKKELVFVYKDIDKNIEILKEFQDLKFYKTSKTIYLQGNLLKFNIYQNNYILNIQLENFLLNLNFSFNDKLLFEQNDTLKFLSYNVNINEGLIINNNEVINNIDNCYMSMLCFDKDNYMYRTLIQNSEKIFDIDHQTNLLYNDWSSSKIIYKDYFETIDNIYYTVTDDNFNHIFCILQKHTYFAFKDNLLSFSY